MYSNANYKYKCLLSIEPYRFSGLEIGKLREDARGRNYENKKYLPDYCIKDDGGIGWSENYHQFTGEFSNKDKYFTLFNINTCDKVLKEELDNSGFEGDYSLLCDIYDWEKIIKDIIENKFNLHNYDAYSKHTHISPQYIVIEIKYYRSSYEYDEWDMDVELLGYLDENLKINEL